MPTALKRMVRSLLSVELIVNSVDHLSCGIASIFMLHRFADPEMATSGHDPQDLRRLLEYLRRRKYRLLPLAEIFSAVEQHRGLSRTVGFTIDDGYRDFHSTGAPIFREYDCPVTVFLTTGFLDGTTWFWWDKVEHMVTNTNQRAVTLPLADGVRTYKWETAEQREGVLAQIVGCLKRIPTAEKVRMLDIITSQLHVDLPHAPPERFAPLSWSQARELERHGVSYGPHTVTHPMLSRATEEQSEWEIRESWRRLRKEVTEFVPIFCYPNGTPESFSAREQGVLRAVGFTAAVTAVDGYVRPGHFTSASPGARYAIPRFALDQDYRGQIRTVAGIKRLRRSGDDNFQKQLRNAPDSPSVVG